MQNNRSIHQKKGKTQNHSSVSWGLLLFGGQIFPSLLFFYFLWPLVFQWQIKEELDNADPASLVSLQKEEKYLRHFHKPLRQEELADTYTKICLLLPCRLIEVNPSQKKKLQSQVNSINIQLALDIYDVPIVLEVMNRVHPSVQLQQLEVHQYEQTKLLLRYEQNLPAFQGVDTSNWLEDYSLLSEHQQLLKQAQAVHDWRAFYREEQRRTEEEAEKLEGLKKELPSKLIQLKKKRGVLLYRPDKGLSYMPLQR